MAKTTVRIPFVLVIILMSIMAALAAPATQAAAQASCAAYNAALASANGYTAGTLSSDLEADLRMAIECANGNNTDDTIDLDGQTVTLDDAPAAYDQHGHTGLPKITSTLTIQNGTIERSSTLTNCDGGSGDRSEFRLFHISDSGTLHLDGVALLNGCASDVEASIYDERGGAIFNRGTLHLNAVHLKDNTSTSWGGAIQNEDHLYVANSSFTGNVSGPGGGAAINEVGDDSYALVVNTTFYKNNSGGRGIILVEGLGEIHLVNSTFTAETSAYSVLNVGTIAKGTNHTIYNVILTDNNADNCNSHLQTATAILATGSYSDDDSCDFAGKGGADNAHLPLAARQTAGNGTVYYPLKAGDALDGGDSSLLPTEADLGIDVDQDGTIENSPISIDQRDGPRDEGVAVDAGAFEFSCGAYYQGLTSNDGYLVGTIFGNLEFDLRQAIDCANRRQGDERITLGGQTVTLDDAPPDYDSTLYGFTGLPRLAPGMLTVEDGVIERDSSLGCDGGQGDRTEFRLFFVQAGAELVLQNMTLRNGCAHDVQFSNSDDDGGAIYNLGTVRLNAVHLEQNEASAGGAINNDGQLYVANSSFVGNITRFAAGVLAQAGSGASSTFVNTTISDNVSVNNLLSIGDGTTLTLINSTLAHNRGNGQTLAFHGTSDPHAIYNTILTNNEMANCNNNVASNATAANNSYSDDNSCGFGANGGMDNSGQVLAALQTAVNGTQYHLLHGGTAVEGGADNLLPSENDLGLDVDQDGTIETGAIEIDQQTGERILGNVVDAGTVEFTCAVYDLPLASTDGYAVGTNNTDLAADLRQAINCANDNSTDDIITLDDQTVTLSDAPAAYDYEGFNSLPPISSFYSLTIQNGTIARDSSLNSCNGGNGDRSDFRLLTVYLNTSLALQNLTLQNGCAHNVDSGANFDNFGGAVFHVGNTLTLNAVNLLANSAGVGGGIYIGNLSTFIAANSSFVGNELNSSGNEGAAYAQLFDVQATFVNTTFSQNDGTGGSIIRLQFHDNTLSFINSTLAENTASDLLSVGDPTNSTYQFHNTVLADNVVTNNCDANVAAVASFSATGSFSDDGSCSFTANGGGDNVTTPLGSLTTAVNGTQYHPLLGGEALGGGDKSLRPNETDLGLDVDQDGTIENSKVSVDQRDSSRVAGVLIDAGAYELSCADYNAGFGSAAGYQLGTVLTDLTADLRQAIDCANGVNSDDLINLNGQTVTLDQAPVAYDEEGLNGLPVIADKGTLTIANGQIERDSSLTTCDGGNGDRSDFRLLFVDYNANLTLQNMVLKNGCAHNVMSGTTIDRYGGAIHNRGYVWLNAVHLGGNSAGTGGAIYNEDELIVANSSFVGNGLNGSQPGGLGAVLVQFGSAEATFVNSTIGQNGAASQTIVQIQSGSLTLINSTLTENIADSVIAFSTTAATDGTHSIHNTILANNTANGNCGGNVASAANISSSNSYSDDNSCSFGTSDGTDSANVTLGSLTSATNGTQYYPLAGGDGLDGGHNSLLPTEATLGLDIDQDGSIENTAIEVDQRGGARVAGTDVDAGAYEATLSLVVSSLDDVEDGDYSFGELTLREAVALAGSGATITFDASLSGGTILLNQTLTIAKDLTIHGNVPITLSGNDSVRVLTVTAGEVTVDSLALVNGRSDSNGAGLHVDEGASVNLLDSTVAHNRATQGFVVGIYNEGTMSIKGSTISDNVTEDRSITGGLLNTGMLAIENSTISGNHGDHIGAILNSGEMTLLHVTVANNTFGDGNSQIGGIANAADLTLTNSLSADNERVDCSSTGSGAVVTDGGHNLIEVDDATNPCGLVDGSNGNIVGTDPQLEPLADNGGATDTHALASNSEAVDVIATCLLSIDQRGVARPQGGSCDMGAYEIEETAVSIDLTMSSSGVLSWLPESGDECTESLYQETNPYAPTYQWLEDGAPWDYDTTASLASVGNNYFYYVTVDCGAGAVESNRVGEFTFTIVPGG
ncbi:MAG: choice-of-anchor Q domain-containing protein [Chloroflexota bacterium]